MINTLSDYDRHLSDKRHRFLKLLDDPQSDLSGWTLCMGNEAGDLDSLASALAYSTFATSTLSASSFSTEFIPLVLTPRDDLYLRPENLESLKRAHVSTDSLLTIDDVPRARIDRPRSSRPHFVLVDHNALLPSFRHDDDDRGDDRVVAIVDHHADEGHHLSARPRTIEPVGSCSSLVVAHFFPSIVHSPSSPPSSSLSETSDPTDHLAPPVPVPTSLPRGLADLLVGAILLDTRLRPTDKGGKATRTDLEAVEFLVPFSSDADSSNPVSTSANESASVEIAVSQGLSSPSTATVKLLLAHEELLSALKADVSWMNGRDLLRRDYKEYVYDGREPERPVGSRDDQVQDRPEQEQEDEEDEDGKAGNGRDRRRAIRYGLATVPLGLEVWLSNLSNTSASSPSSSTRDPKDPTIDSTDGRRPLDPVALDLLIRDVASFMTERSLDLCGVLTSYSHVGRKSGKSKHRREVVVVVRALLDDDDDDLSANASSRGRGRGRGRGVVDREFARSILDGLERDEVLRFETWKLADEFDGRDASSEARSGGRAHDAANDKDREEEEEEGKGLVWKVWQQGNTKATRKQVAPVLRTLLEHEWDAGVE
ncbi:hypothetical protein JCM10212_000183 [Sporobolomyces blumeae]